MTPQPTAPRRSIGIITPSANVVVEWTAIRLLRAFPDVGVHFARVPIRGEADSHPDGYDLPAMLRAARLLADAGPRVILWAGSKGVLVGLEADEALCAAIEAETGVPAITPTIALSGWADVPRRVALVTPYTASYQRRVIAGLARLGIDCVSERHAGVSDNLAYADVAPQQIADMAREAVREAGCEAGPALDFVMTWCTNFAAAAAIGDIEREFAIPLVDATLLGLRQALAAAGVDLSPGRAWGRLFQPWPGARA